MKKLVVGLVVAVVACASFAQETVIELKGIRIGMTKAEVEQLYPKGLRDFTVAGTGDWNGSGPRLLYDKDDKVEMFLMTINETRYKDIKEAIEGKYGALKCSQSVVQNGMGAKFDQEQCYMTLGGTILNIKHYDRDLKSGRLALASTKSLEESKKEEDQKKKDI